MHIAKSIELSSIDALNPGACFLFEGFAAVEIGIVVKFDGGAKGFLAPAPSNKLDNDIPQIYQAHALVSEEVRYLPDATVVLSSSLEDLSANVHSLDHSSPVLVSTKDGLFLRSVYRRVNLMHVDILSGAISRTGYREGFAHKNWSISVKEPDGRLVSIKTFAPRF